MDFYRYQHIERLGTIDTDGIEFGECYVFPKIDGSNSQLWWNNGLQAGSRNRHLTLENDNQGFYAWALKQKQFETFFKEFPTARLFGEWLVPHTLKTYEDNAWNKFYVFDVRFADKYVDYNTYKSMLHKHNIEYIPPICIIQNPTHERLIGQLDKNGYLIKDGEGAGEGIVIKNYNYRNKFGRQIWAKIVRNEFKAKHWNKQPTVVKEKNFIEQKIVDKFLSESLIEKEYAKIVNDTGGWSTKLIPRLLNTVFYCLVKEESWSFVKENKNPVIDFKKLYQLTIQKVKTTKPDLF